MFEPEAEGSCVSLRGGPQLLELPRRSGRLGADAGNGECTTGGVQPTHGDVPAKTHRRVERHENRRVLRRTDTIRQCVMRFVGSKLRAMGRRGGQTVEGLSKGNQIRSGK